MSRPQWFDQLVCVQCYGSLRDEPEGLRCEACGIRYPFTEGGIPILMTPKDRQRFRLTLGQESASGMEAHYERRHQREWASRVWRAISPPEPVYVDHNAPPLPHAPSGHAPESDDELILWLLDTGRFVNVDISPFYGVDVVAHAGRLPFPESSCTRIACLALLEHVPDPEEVVREMLRTLQPKGRVEAVVPFCHPYHAYPSDYSRFSKEGLDLLFSDFELVEIGIRTGPTTTMLTFMTYYGKLIFPVHANNLLRRWFNRCVMGIWGWTTAPFAYLDRWVNRLPDAHVLANHFYVTARKPDEPGP